MDNIKKIRELYRGTSTFVDQAISLIDVLDLSKEDFETVTDLATVTSLPDFQRRTRYLARHQRQWLCKKMIEYGFEMLQVTEADFSYDNIDLFPFFPNLQRIQISHVGRIRNDQSKISLKSLTRLETIHLEGCQTEWDLPSSVKNITARYSELHSLNLDELPNLVSLELVTTKVKDGIQITDVHPSLRTLRLENSTVNFEDTFKYENCPQLERIQIHVLRGTDIHFQFKHPHLRHIEIRESNLKFVFPVPLRRLETLSLIDCENCTTLQLPTAPVLNRLVVQGLPIGVLELSDLPTLLHLDLSLTDIQSIDLSRIPNVEHIELQHSQIESLDCSPLSSLRFLSAHSTPLHSLFGLAESVQVLMLHQTNLKDKPAGKTLRYLSCLDTTESNWEELQDTIESLQKMDWMQAGKKYDFTMLEPLKHHFGTCLDKGRIRRVQCEFFCRHDYVDLAFTSDGKAVVLTDPGWDGVRLQSTDVEDVALNSFQVQCLFDLLCTKEYWDLDDQGLMDVFHFESIGEGDGEDYPEVIYIDPKIPLSQLIPDMIGAHPSDSNYVYYRENYKNLGTLRYQGGNGPMESCQINGVQVPQTIFEILLWLESRSTHGSPLPKLDWDISLYGWVYSIAYDLYPSVQGWTEFRGNLLPVVPVTSGE